MRIFFILISGLFFYASSAKGEKITIVDTNPADLVGQMSPIGQVFDLNGDQDNFYDMTSSLPFAQSSPMSFVQQDDSLRFLGQPGSQMLIVEDGIPQTSATGIGGGRSFQFLDPFFYDQVFMHIGGGTSQFGAGAFSGVMQLSSNFKPREKFLLSTGTYGLQKIGHKKVVHNNYGLWSFEGMRHVKSGPSLVESSNEKEAEEDGRALHVIRLKWKKEKSELGPLVQFNFFRDEQDFDQFQADDGRPFSNEINAELVAKLVSVVNTDKVWTNIQRFQINKRQVRNVLGGTESSLTYSNKSLFFSSSLKAIDFMNLDLFEVGFDSSTDFSIEMSEGAKTAPGRFTAGGVFVKGTKGLGLEGSRINMSARFDGSTSSNGASAQIGLGTKFYDFDVHSQIGRNSRLPSYYELFSIYGDDQLVSEKNTAVEASIKKYFNAHFIRLMAYFQDQKDLIYYDTGASRYKNIVDNSYYGFGVDGKFGHGRLTINYAANYNVSENKEFLLGVAPVKFHLKLGYQISKNLSARVEEVYFGNREQFSGVIDSTLWSTLNLRYQIDPSFFATLRGQLESPLISSDGVKRKGSELLQISLQGVL